MKIRITNSLGQLVKESQVNSLNHYEMLINNLKADIYNVEFISQKGSEVRKIKVGQKTNSVQ